MKILNYTFLLFSLIVILSCKKAEQDITPKDFVSYYAFNGNTNDSKGNQSSIVNYRTKLTTDKNGNANSAYAFDGTAYLELPVPTAKNVFTYSIWANATETPQSGTIGVVFSVGSAGGDQLVSTANNYANVSGWSLTTYNSDATNLGLNTGGLSSLIINKWTHLVISRDSENFKAYVDGKLLGTLPTKGKNAGYGNDTPKFYIGSRHTGQTFIGSIDELKVFDRALTDSEVLALYTSY